MAKKTRPTAETWEELLRLWTGCIRCSAHEKRQLVVFGTGPRPATFMVIGQWPGKDEDKSGVPFQGAGGRYTHEALKVAGISPEEVFFDNVLACRATKSNKTQRDACTPRLEDTIKLVQPKLIIAVGAIASKWLSGTQKSLDILGGTRGDYQGTPAFYTTHPLEPARTQTPDAFDKSVANLRWEFLELGAFARELELLPERWE